MMGGKRVMWDDLDLMFAQRIDSLNLNAQWKFLIRNISATFLYTIRKAIEDGMKEES